MSAPVVIRSYRAVFELERRIYRIDRLRLNPGGVPIRGILYFLTLAVGALLLSALPLLGAIARALPWYMRAIALPGAGACMLAVLRIDGRPFHLAALSLLREARRPRRLDGAGRRLEQDRAWRPAPLLCLPDGSEARMRRLSYKGPGTVLVFAAHERAERVAHAGARARGAPALMLRELSGGRLPRPSAIVLHGSTRLRVRR
ncbi:MAG: hypothetical protein ACYCU0_13955 [Solirubrobacteraceae bacterium]